MQQTLSLSLTPPQIPGENWWIALEQITPPLGATYEEAAALLDEVFELDPCIPADEPDPDVDEPSRAEKQAAALERYLELVRNGLGAELCDDAEDGWTAQVKVKRSHQDRRYTILSRGGRIVQTSTGHVERVQKSVKVELATSITGLNLPADQTITASWQGQSYTAAGPLDAAPEIVVDRGRVYWDGRITGVVSLAYDQPYDIIDIEVEEEDCSLTGLYHLSVDEITLEPPEQDEAGEDYCEAIREVLEFPEDEGDCLRETYNMVLCDCSGQESGQSERVLSDAPCPDGVEPGTIVERKTERSYVWCPGEEDEVNDPAYYLDKCCESWPFSYNMPRCKSRKEIFTGKGLDPERRAQLLRAYPGANIVLVGPKDPPCGTMYYDQKVNARNCCDGVPQLVHDEENSADVAPENGYCDVYVTGGITPIFWKVRGQGFYTNSAHNQRDALTTGRHLRIYTENSCGSAVIYATDGCSSVSFYIRGFLGAWEAVSEEEMQAIGSLRLEATRYTGSGSGFSCGAAWVGFEAISGIYKATQRYAASGNTESSLSNTSADAACAGLASNWREIAESEYASHHGFQGDEPELIDHRSVAALTPDPPNLYLWWWLPSDQRDKAEKDGSVGFGADNYVIVSSSTPYYTCYTRGFAYVAPNIQDCPTWPTLQRWVCGEI